jgi:hypothetical protein
LYTVAADVQKAPARGCLDFPHYWRVGEVVAWERRTLHLICRTQGPTLGTAPITLPRGGSRSPCFLFLNNYYWR